MSLEKSKSYEKGKHKQLTRLIQTRTERKYLSILREVQKMDISEVEKAIDAEYSLVNKKIQEKKTDE